jgi:cysteine desulfurase/selenocysteine lyase
MLSEAAIKTLRADFPFFAHPQQGHNNLVYLDSAATTQRLQAVLDSTDHFTRYENASVHRASYPLANASTRLFEQSRSATAKLINAVSSDEIVFTSGATESLNTVAQGLTKQMLKGTRILVCASEHHANLLPWQALAKRFGLTLEIMPLDAYGTFSEATLALWLAKIDEDVALVACAHVSNVLGNIYPVQALCEKAQSVGALSVIDGTQALAHIGVDVQQIACDFYVFSGHKMYGPSGIGVLWGRYQHLDAMQASKLGGEMVTHVSYESFSTAQAPIKFEAGTPNISGVIGLKAAVDYLLDKRSDIMSHEHILYERLLAGLDALTGLTLFGNKQQSIAIVSFRFNHLDNHSAVLQLYQQGFALRYGQHCAMPLLQSLGIDACLRVSLGCYNTIEEVDAFITNIIALSNCLSDAPESAAKTVTQAHKLSFENSLILATSWPEKHRQLLLLSKHLPSLPIEKRNANNSVSGCEASVWLDVESASASVDTNAKVLGYSDSKVVRGLMTVLLLKHAALSQEFGAKQINDNKPERSAHLNTFDYFHYLDELGLSSYFSEGRKDGMRALIERLMSFN